MIANFGTGVWYMVDGWGTRLEKGVHCILLISKTYTIRWGSSQCKASRGCDEVQTRKVPYVLMKITKRLHLYDPHHFACFIHLLANPLLRQPVKC